MSNTRRFVAVSEYVRRRAIAKAPHARSKMRVVLPGVDLTHFAPRATALTGPPRFAIAARLEPRKGVDLALRALALVPEAELDIAGDGAERPKLEKLARAVGVAHRVRFHGFVDDPREVIAASVAVLCSSREEGLGVAYLEAMAMARPIVGFAVGGVVEIVRDEDTGLLVVGAEASALASRMRDALRDRSRLEALGTRARAWAVRAAGGALAAAP